MTNAFEESFVTQLKLLLFFFSSSSPLDINGKESADFYDDARFRRLPHGAFQPGELLFSRAWFFFSVADVFPDTQFTWNSVVELASGVSGMALIDH